MSNTADNEAEEAKNAEKLKQICRVLNLSAVELKQCEHRTDITKIGRYIVKRLYPDIQTRATMLISSTSSEILQAIHGK